MDSDFSEKLKTVLSDPTALAKISAIAESMGLGAPSAQSEAPSEPPPAEPTPQTIAQSILPARSADPRMMLLETLKPLLKEEKRGRVDSIERALTVMNVMKTLRK